MKILITGSTGFLGKFVLRQLLERDEVEVVYALSRKKSSYPSDKVKVINADLSLPLDIEDESVDFDAVIHLAGKYNFYDDYADNYVNNIVATSNLLGWLKKNRPNNDYLLHFASSYSVSLDNWKSNPPEQIISSFPDKEQSYANTKAVSEQSVLESGIDSCVYRLGILVGSQKAGYIEKIDGPYYVVKFLKQIGSNKLTRFLPRIPFFGEPDCYLPLVPVDVAAKAFVEGVLNPQRSKSKIYGVYNPKSIFLNDLLIEALDACHVFGRPHYIEKMPPALKGPLEALAKIPTGVFDFTSGVPALNNKAFQKDFGVNMVPKFSSYRVEFFRGYEEFQKTGVL